MTKQEELEYLISQAIKATGSEEKLATELIEPLQNVTAWRTGCLVCSPENQALLAKIAGFDPIATLARAVVQQHENKMKAGLLEHALRKAFASDWRGAKYRWSKVD